MQLRRFSLPTLALVLLLAFFLAAEANASSGLAELKSTQNQLTAISRRSLRGSNSDLTTKIQDLLANICESSVP